jgi:integrase
MASFHTSTDSKGNTRVRALVRKAGQTKCATFPNETQAKKWAKLEESRLDELRATGAISPRSMTIADLIDRYVEELQDKKQWGRSKAADLARLRLDLGAQRVSTVTTAHLVNYFVRRNNEGSGPVVIAAQAGYLAGVFKTARTLWHLDVPVAAVQGAIDALRANDLAGKSKARDRRVSDAEIALLVEHFELAPTGLPMADIIRFCVATGMRISEVCRLQWSDLDTAKTITIRDRKHPTEKVGNDQVVPLLNATGFDAFEIVKRQPRTNGEIFPVNPKTVVTYVPRAVQAIRARLAEDRGVAVSEVKELAEFHLHDLRHEAISRLFAAGYRIEQVALVSGHRSWVMLKRYTHVKAADLHRGPGVSHG